MFKGSIPALITPFDNDKIDLETDVMPKLASDGELMMYKHEGFWASMDTLKDAQNLNNVWNNSAPWKEWGD